MDPLRHGELHVAHTIGTETAARLRRWDLAVQSAPAQEAGPWQVELFRHLRGATVGASTRIEGNPLTIQEVAAVLQGDAVEATPEAQREVANYGQALNLVTSLAVTPDFAWSHMVFSAINGLVLQGLPEDRQGRYRDGPVFIGDSYEGPDASRVQHLMAALIDWTATSTDHPLVRAALLHLNVLAIHPWFDGNGRTSRIVSTLELMRSGVRSPELVSIEPYLASHRDEYIGHLQAAHGSRYQPEEHSATDWVDFVVRISTDRLSIDVRLREALEHDYGLLSAELERSGEPLDWLPTLWLAAALPVRSRILADAYSRSMPWARARLAEIAAQGWLRQVGRTRSASYVAAPRLQALDLWLPGLMQRFDDGGQLSPDRP